MKLPFVNFFTNINFIPEIFNKKKNLIKLREFSDDLFKRIDVELDYDLKPEDIVTFQKSKVIAPSLIQVYPSVYAMDSILFRLSGFCSYFLAIFCCFILDLNFPTYGLFYFILLVIYGIFLGFTYHLIYNIIKLIIHSFNFIFLLCFSLIQKIFKLFNFDPITLNDFDKNYPLFKKIFKNFKYFFKFFGFLFIIFGFYQFIKLLELFTIYMEFIEFLETVFARLEQEYLRLGTVLTYNEAYHKMYMPKAKVRALWRYYGDPTTMAIRSFYQLRSTGEAFKFLYASYFIFMDTITVFKVWYTYTQLAIIEEQLRTLNFLLPNFITYLETNEDLLFLKKNISSLFTNDTKDQLLSNKSKLTGALFEFFSSGKMLDRFVYFQVCNKMNHIYAADFSNLLFNYLNVKSWTDAKTRLSSYNRTNIFSDFLYKNNYLSNEIIDQSPAILNMLLRHRSFLFNFLNLYSETLQLFKLRFKSFANNVRENKEFIYSCIMHPKTTRGRSMETMTPDFPMGFVYIEGDFQKEILSPRAQVDDKKVRNYLNLFAPDALNAVDYIAQEKFEYDYENDCYKSMTLPDVEIAYLSKKAYQRYCSETANDGTWRNRLNLDYDYSSALLEDTYLPIIRRMVERPLPARFFGADKCLKGSFNNWKMRGFKSFVRDPKSEILPLDDWWTAKREKLARRSASKKYLWAIRGNPTWTRVHWYRRIKGPDPVLIAEARYTRYKYMKRRNPQFFSLREYFDALKPRRITKMGASIHRYGWRQYNRAQAYLDYLNQKKERSIKHIEKRLSHGYGICDTLLKYKSPSTARVKFISGYLKLKSLIESEDYSWIFEASEYKNHWSFKPEVVYIDKPGGADSLQEIIDGTYDKWYFGDPDFLYANKIKPYSVLPCIELTILDHPAFWENDPEKMKIIKKFVETWKPRMLLYFNKNEREIPTKFKFWDSKI